MVLHALSSWSSSVWASPVGCSSSSEAFYPANAHRVSYVMICDSPVQLTALAVPCGQCMPCRINRKRIWTHRVMLEALDHTACCFLTLTYEQTKLPLSSTGLPTLTPKHTQDWLKRLRKALTPLSIRYFLVGEYGEQTERPHYHVAVFGYGGCEYVHRCDMFPQRTNVCGHCRVYRSSWGHGNIVAAELSAESAAYVCGYVTKKMTAVGDERLKGRHPEFARMSLRPGIGAGFVDRWLNSSTSPIEKFNLVESQGDVPSALRHGSRILPFGRYLKSRMRARFGVDGGITGEYADEMLRLLLASRSDPQGRSVASIARGEGAAQARSSVNKDRIFRKRGSL